jgi:hypothetical protein
MSRSTIPPLNLGCGSMTSRTNLGRLVNFSTHLLAMMILLLAWYFLENRRELRNGYLPSLEKTSTMKGLACV